jgi:hypothetical protein
MPIAITSCHTLSKKGEIKAELEIEAGHACSCLNVYATAVTDGF